MADYTQDANCAGAWLFTEGSGETVADASGNSNSGTFKGSGEPAWYNTTSPASYTDWAVDFDGNDDYIDTNDTSLLEGASTYSVTYWINPDNTGTASQGVLCKWAEGQYSVLLRLYYGEVQGGVRGSNGQESYHASTTASLSNGTWAHIGTIWDGGKNWTFYVDGVDAGDVELWDSQSPSDTVNDATSEAWFGKDERGNTIFLDGKLTELGAFSRVTNSTEVNDIMDNGLEGGAAPAAATGILNTRSGYWGDL